MKINPNSSPKEFDSLKLPPAKMDLPPAKIDILDAIKESESSIGGFVMGFISQDCLAKLINNDAVRIEIEITSSIIEFADAVENKTAVIIRTSEDGKPRFEFSSEIHRLIETNEIEDFALTSDDSTVIFKKDEVETARYTVSEINAFVLLFFSGLESKNQTISTVTADSKGYQKPLYPLRDRSEQLDFRKSRKNQAKLVTVLGKLLKKTEAFFKDQMINNANFQRHQRKAQKAEKASEENAAYMKERAQELSEKLRSRNISVESPVKLTQPQN